MATSKGPPSYRHWHNPGPASILARPEGRALPFVPSYYYASMHKFQSSPGPRAGRCRSCRPTTTRRCTSFNPRPARGPGAAPSPVPIACSFSKFQSSPGPRAGRCRLALLDSAILDIVSILARPEGRALLAVVAVSQDQTLFQSSPGPRAGRCDSGNGSGNRSTGFNPRPAILFQSSPGPRAGRCPASSSPTRPTGTVSILARPEGRALHVERAEHGLVGHVSILARPEGRALHVERAEHGLVGHVSILARPEGRALHVERAEHGLVGHVSILARPEGRALPRRQPTAPGGIRVSILARPEGRALRWLP